VHDRRPCTIGALLALVTHLDVADDEYVGTEWRALGGAFVSLLYTADFLMLDEVVQDLVRHCTVRAQSWAEADVAQILAVTLPNEAVTRMLQGLVGVLDAAGANIEGLVDEMATCEVLVNGERMTVLSAWLAHRPLDPDVRSVLGWFPWTVFWDREGDLMTLRPGATDLVRTIGRVGVERPQLFGSVVETLFWCSRWKVNFVPAELSEFMGCSFGTLWNGRRLSAEELGVLFRRSMSMPYADGLCGSELLPLAVGAASDALQKVATDGLMQSPRFPAILSVPLLAMLNPDLRAAVVAHVLPDFKECSQEVQSFIVSAVAHREL